MRAINNKKRKTFYLGIIAVLVLLGGVSYADEISQSKEESKKGIYESPKADKGNKPGWLDKIKISGSLCEYFIWQDNVYFSRNKKDSFLETISRVDARVFPCEDLDFNLGVVGQHLAGDANEYSGVTNHGFSTKLEFANFTKRNLLDLPLKVTVGRQNIEFGDGLLIYDFFSDKRTAWTRSIRSLYALRTTYNPSQNFTLDIFAGQTDKSYISYETYLKDNIKYGGLKNVSGINLHYDAKEFGIWELGTFYKHDKSALQSDTLALSLRSSYNVAVLPRLTIEAELVPEWGRTNVKNGVLSATRQNRRSLGGYFDTIYSFRDKTFSPYLKAGYYYFPGDDPSSDKNEAFDAMFYGAKDWGKWYLGSISVNLFHTNQRTALFEAGLNPTKRTQLRLMCYDLSLDRENNANAGKHFSNQWNTVFSWFPNDYLFCGAEFGYAHPLKAGRAYFGDKKNILETVTWLGVRF